MLASLNCTSAFLWHLLGRLFHWLGNWHGFASSGIDRSDGVGGLMCAFAASIATSCEGEDCYCYDGKDAANSTEDCASVTITRTLGLKRHLVDESRDTASRLV